MKRGSKMKDLIRNTIDYLCRERRNKWWGQGFGEGKSFTDWCKEQEETKLINGLQEELDKL